MKRKNFRFSLALGLGSALLVIALVLLHPSAQKSIGHPLIEVPVSPADAAEADVPYNRVAKALPSTPSAPAAANPSPSLDKNAAPESALPPVMRAPAPESQTPIAAAQMPDLPWIAARNQRTQVELSQPNLPLSLAANRALAPTQSPQIYARYDTAGRNDVFGFNAVADSPVWITITHPVDGIIASGSTTAGACDWCNSTDYQLGFPDWTFSPGVSVTVDCGGGLIESVEVVSITGDPNPDTDMVIGTAPAEGELNAFVQQGGNQAFINDVQVDASGVYTLDFGTAGWDILPGDEFHVYYHAPGGHNVESVFWLPAPEVRLVKLNPGGFARPGGKIVYRVAYWNNGDGPADDTVIVDTLPLSTTYAGDTSGLTPDIGADGVITWHLGSLPPAGNVGYWGVFAVTLDVAGDIPTGNGVLTPNCAAISTASPGDNYPDNDTACAGPIDVWNSDVGINVDKWPNLNDPTPGQEFDYTIRWCSDYGANFGPVWLTDTLPVSTTLLSWSNDWGLNMWNVVSAAGGQFALYAPGLPGDRCQHITLRLLLDPNAPQGMTLRNHVVVATPGDAQPDNNERLNTDARVSGPRYDMNTNKWYNQGVLVSDGWIRYGTNWWNAGNTAVHAWLTDTLPAGTSYRPGSAQRHDGQSFEPAIVTAGYVVWDLGMVAVNDGYGLDFTLDISDTTASGTVLTNCTTVGGNFIESTPNDNTACVAVKLYPNGPNLRVTKEHWWNGDGRLGYRIRFYNLGDTTISNVWITDTLPAGTAWDGWWNMNFDRNRLVEESLTGDVLAWRFSELYPGDSGNIEFNANLDDPGAPMRWYTNTVEITLPAGDTDPADNTYTDVAFSGGEVQSVDFDILRTRVWGCAPRGPVTVATALAEMTFGNCWDEQNFPDTFDPGDVITVTAGAGLHPVIVTIPDPFTAYASSITDTVWGQIDALANAAVDVSVWGLPSRGTTTDANGHYSVVFPDVPRGAQGDVNGYTEIDYAQIGFHRRFQTPDLVVSVDYSNNGVDATYERGHTGWVTVTNDVGTGIRATVEVTTEAWPWWGGGSGFSTHHHQWMPSQPDIEPYNWVSATLDNGYTTTVQVGAINAVVDVDNDIVSGTLDVPWFSEGLRVRCEIHMSGAPSIEVGAINPDGSEVFICDYSGMWDIVPGNPVVVRYTEPDGDEVLFRPANPAPHMRVEKWWDGGGNPGAGGNAVFFVQYANFGDGDAENVVITDTLQGMTYITDTSGFMHTGSGNQVVLDLGTVAPGDWIHFYVYAEVNAAAGERVTNTVAIATSNLYDQGDEWEKRSEWSGDVVPNDTRLNVGKDAWTGDPAAGYDVVFHVRACNNGGTGSTQVTLTDTLHLSMTLKTWWSDNPGWSEVSRSAQDLVVTKPSIGPWRCEGVYVRAYVDAAARPGMNLSNHAVIYAANDSPDNDNETWWWGSVNDPHTNLNINKAWDWGQLTPGGELHYNINYQNNGNVPVTSPIRITDTLPISTTFIGISNFYGGPPVTPVFTGTNYVVFEVAGLDNGYSGGFQVALQVDSNALPGTLLTNTVEIERQPVEDNTDDNISTAVETLYPHGPNLRVRKDGGWHGYGEGHNAWYQMVVENVGDEPVTRNVTITDTYPISMSLDGGVGIDWYGGWWDWRDNPAEHYFTATVQPLGPGGRAKFNFNTQIPGSDPVPGGLILTNTVEVMLAPTDTYDLDNVDFVVLTTGPDLYVEKTLVDGKLLPGELLTFSLRFGNDREGWQGWWAMQGNAVLTDTLPEGFEYVSAIQHWCGPGGEWCDNTPTQVGNLLVWELWPLNAGEWNELYVTVRITDTATGLDAFTNWAEIGSDQPAVDIEPYTDNNANYVDVMIDLPHFEVSKDYASSRVAGMPVTYTLTVTNVGNSAGTNVVLGDKFPTGFTYTASDGVRVGNSVQWTFTALAADDVGTGWFSGLLPCATVTVINNDYAVINSDEGVTSAVGAPVSVAVIAPTLNAGFDQSATAAVVDSTLFFTDTSTTNGPAIIAWAWDFGDGAAGSGSTANHAYTRDGVFTVKLTVTDTCGYSDFHTATVQSAPPTLAANFDQSATAAVVDSTLFFTDTSTTNGPAITAWAWDFGDGAAGSGATANHTYTTDGAFTVKLTVTDTLGYAATTTSVVTVTAPTIVASFTQSTTSADIGAKIFFTDTSTTNVPPILAWAWDFGDNTRASTQNASHAYNAEGTFTVTLTVTDTLGYSDMYSASIQVKKNRYTIFLPLVLRNH